MLILTFILPLQVSDCSYWKIHPSNGPWNPSIPTIYDREKHSTYKRFMIYQPPKKHANMNSTQQVCLLCHIFFHMNFIQWGITIRRLLCSFWNLAYNIKSSAVYISSGEGAHRILLLLYLTITSPFPLSGSTYFPTMNSILVPLTQTSTMTLVPRAHTVIYLVPSLLTPSCFSLKYHQLPPQ